MSKSYKKIPIVKYEKVDKKLSNRYFRHCLKDVLNTRQVGTYKRYTYGGDWNATSLWTKQDAEQFWLSGGNHFSYFYKEWPTLESYLNYWARCVQRK